MGAFFRDDGDGGFEPPRWDVGDPIGFGNDIGAPEIPSINEDSDCKQEKEEFSPKPNPKIPIAKTLSDEAFRLYQDGRCEEALVLINVALENDDSIANYWNIKGIILGELGEYPISEVHFNEALLMENDSVILANKVRMYYQWAKHLNDNTHDYKRGFEIITKALKMLPDIKEEMDKESFLKLKSSLFNNMKNKVSFTGDSVISGPSITLTGPGFFPKNPLHVGGTVDFIKEPENPYDEDAIRIEFEGTKIGYVANSPHTVLNSTRSASEIKTFFEMTTTGTVSKMENGHIIIQLDI